MTLASGVLCQSKCSLLALLLSRMWLFRMLQAALCRSAALCQSCHLRGSFLQDEQRNAAYQGAIQRAVALLRASREGSVTALDIGAGSGLLSMMAAR